MKKQDIKNWKLVEVIDKINIIADDSSDYFDDLVKKLSIPIINHTTINRTHTHINWQKMPGYFKFFLDGEVEENENESAFRNSALSEKENLIILYGWKEPAVLLPTKMFVEDREDFIASTQWEAIMFSEDFELIMEVSRDYHLHSNFKVK